MKVAWSCPTLWPDGLPDSSVHSILQARIMEWVDALFSRGSSQLRDRTQVLPHCWETLYRLNHGRKSTQRSALRALGWQYLMSFNQHFSGPALLQVALRAEYLLIHIKLSIFIALFVQRHPFYSFLIPGTD